MASLFSAASALLTGQRGPLPNYTLGEKDAWFEGRTIWSMYAATRREDGSACTVLAFDTSSASQTSRKSCLPLAKNALRRLRTTRHPDVIRLLDSTETATAVYVAVERVRPLGKVMEEMRHGRTPTAARQMDEWVGWGLSKVTNALRFLHQDMRVTHGNVRMDSIFVAASGEWRLGGLELISSNQEGSMHDELGQHNATINGPPAGPPSAISAPLQKNLLYTMGGAIPDPVLHAPPEVKQGGWSILQELDLHIYDAYAFGRVIVEAYNGSLPPGGASVPPQGRVPMPLYTLVKRMLLPNAKSRLTIVKLAEETNADPGGLFTENRLVKLAKGLDGFILASEETRLGLLKIISTEPDSFPLDFLQCKVLPTLVDAMRVGGTPSGASSAATNGQMASNMGPHGVPPPAPVSVTSASLHPSRLMPLILRLGKTLPDAEWTRTVAPTILKTFRSTDRAVRMALLENLTTYLDRLDGKQISDQIWPQLLTGFVDTSPVIREATLRSILPLSDRLTERILNNDLLRQLARAQVDTEPQIRTNTTILLGNLAPKLSLSTRQKVLVPAFIRSLKDTFVHARMAGLMAFMATADSFDPQECARQIIPAICPLLIDGSKAVRREAKVVTDHFLTKVQEHAGQMADADEADGTSNDPLARLAKYSSTTSTAKVNGSGSLTENAATALAQWIRSSAGAKVDMPNAVTEVERTSMTTEQTSMTNSYTSDTISSSVPPSEGGTTSGPADVLDDMYDDAEEFLPMDNTQQRLSTKPKLGARKASSIPSAQTRAAFTAPALPVAPSWSQAGDLMDVMDDNDDWSTFAAAPSASKKQPAAISSPTPPVVPIQQTSAPTPASPPPQSRTVVTPTISPKAPSTLGGGLGHKQIKSRLGHIKHKVAARDVKKPVMDDAADDAWDSWE